MLIYTVALEFDTSETLPRIQRVLAEWIGRRVHVRLPPESLGRDMDTRYVAGERLSVLTAIDDIPRRYSISFKHTDSEIHGREWITEIGISETPGGPLTVTILLRTEEMSVFSGSQPPQFSVPSLVAQLFERCVLSKSTPGVAEAKRLTADRDVLLAYEQHIENPARRHCVVVVSATRDGTYTVDVERLRKQLLGLAEVVTVPPGVDTRAFAELLPTTYYTWNGGINLIYPPITFGHERKIITHYVQGSEVTGDTWRDLLSRITHRSNRYLQSLHVSPGRVYTLKRVQELHRQKQAMIEAGQSSGLSGEYIKLLEETNAALEAQVRELGERVEGMEDTEGELREEIEQQRYRINTLQMENDKLHTRVKAIPAGPTARFDPSGLRSMAELISPVTTFLGDRLVLTSAAVRSMQDSPFRDIPKSWQVFQLLAGSLGKALGGGGSLSGALEELRELGVEYKPKMSDVTKGRSAGWERRYKGRAADMDKHLAIGSSRKPEACLRIHFEYDPEDRVIVVHHAGRHLDVMRS